MKKVTLSLMAVMAISSYGFAGGDIVPVPVIMDEVDNSSFYVGAGLVANLTYVDDSSFFGEEDGQERAGGLGLIVGYNFNQYIAIEGRFTATLFDEDALETTTYSIFAKPQYPVTEAFKIYGLLGFGGVNVDTTSDLTGVFRPANVNVNLVDETDFQWGLGASYAVTEEVEIFLDYTSLLNGADIDARIYAWDPKFYSEINVDAITLGVTYKF